MVLFSGLVVLLVGAVVMADAEGAFFTRLRVPREFIDAQSGPRASQASSSLHVPRPCVDGGFRDRDDYFHLLPEPHHHGGAGLLPGVQGPALDVVRRANHTLAVLRALGSSQLDLACRGPAPHHDRRRFQRVGEHGQRASLNILKRWASRPPPPDRPRGEAALAQLLGSRARSSAYGTVMAEPHSGQLRKGDLCHAVPWAVSLPAPGHIPVDICSISPRCAAVLNDLHGSMLRPEPERDELRQHANIRPFTDPGLRSRRDRLWLAMRMWLGGMLGTCRHARGFVDIFTVVKKLLDDPGPNHAARPPARSGRRVPAHPGPPLSRHAAPDAIDQRLRDIGLVERPVKVGDQHVLLRAVFDERLNNLSWQRPPWCSLASVEAISQLDFSDLAGRGFVAEAACGDVADWYYRLRTPPALWEYFCLQDVPILEFFDLLVTCGFVPDFDRDADLHLCTCVLVMGFSWAVYLAQTALEDVLDTVGGAFSHECRLVHSVQVQGLRESHPFGAWGYIDDFGTLGMRPPDGDHLVWEAADHAADALRALGFVVHKEQRGDHIEALGMYMGAPPASEGNPSGIIVRGLDRKMWLCYEALLFLAQRDFATVDEVESVISLATWMVLPARPALSVFSAVYAFNNQFRGMGPVQLWPSVRNELGAMAGVLILAEAALDRPWDTTVYMVDASPSGGAVLSTKADLDEITTEARWAQHGGWMRWLDHLCRDADGTDGYECEHDSHAEAASSSAAASLPRPPPKLTVYVLFALFHGARRKGDLQDAWEEAAFARGAVGIVVAVDIRYGQECDIRDPDRREQLLRRIRADGDAVQARPPRSTWSRALSRPGGPPPARFRQHPWGLPGLSRRLQRRVDLQSDLLRFAWDAAEAISIAGGFNLIEHPEDPGPPHPSSWATPLVAASEASCNNRRYSLDQCTFGSLGRMPTTLSTNAPLHLVRKHQLDGRCPGASATHRHEPLESSGPGGPSKTQEEQEHTPSMCRAIAEMLLDAVQSAPRLDQDTKEWHVSFSDVVRARFEHEEQRLYDHAKKQVPPASSCWDAKSRWSVVVKLEWKYQEHNNVTEARAAMLAVRRQARRLASWGRRVLVIGDSQVTIGVLSKGRSSSWGLLRQCRKLASLHLGLGISVVLRYIPTDRNLADGPSRGWRIGVAPKISGHPRLPLFEVPVATPGPASDV